MKTKPIELIVISFFIILTLILSGVGVLLLNPIYRDVLHDYHILFDFFIFIVLFILFSAVTVRVLLAIAPLSPGNFDMLSRRAFYWKLITSITEVGGMYFLPLTPLFLKPLLFRLFGARIGKNAEIAGKLIELPLIKIEEYAFIGGGVFITAHAITHDSILLDTVTIRKRATIGLGAIVMPGAEIGENSIVAPGAVVSEKTKIPPNEVWGGVPARKLKDIEPS